MKTAIKDLEDSIRRVEYLQTFLIETQEKNENVMKEVKEQIKEDFNAIKKAVDAREAELLGLVEELWEKKFSYGDQIGKVMGKPKKAKQVLSSSRKIEELRNAAKDLEQTIHESDANITLANFEFEYRRGFEDLIEDVRKFGNVFMKPAIDVTMKESPASKYDLEGPCNTVIRKTSSDGWDCTAIGDRPLPQNAITAWDVKVVSTRNSYIMIGVAPADIDVESRKNYSQYGWYLYCYDSALYSGPPHKCDRKSYGQDKSIHSGDVVSVLMDTAKGELSFSVNRVYLGVACSGIPLDKPLVPVCILDEKDDTVEILRPNTYTHNAK